MREEAFGIVQPLDLAGTYRKAARRVPAPRLDLDTKRFINHLSLEDTWDTFGLIAQVVGKIEFNAVRIQVLDQDAVIAVIGAMNRLPMLRRFSDLNCARKFNFRIQAFQNTYHIPRVLIYPPQKGITASK